MSLARAVQGLITGPRNGLGIDLGTSMTLVYRAGQGIVCAEPSVVARHCHTRDVIAVGAEAHAMLGKTPPDFMTVRPLERGVVADYRSVEDLLRPFVRETGGSWPWVVIGVPASATELERHATQVAVEQVGARHAFVVEAVVAGAIGAGLPVAEPTGSMIVDIGAGTTDVAVIALGGLLVHHAVPVAGDALDAAIVQFAERELGLVISVPMAERAKIIAGSAGPLEAERQVVLRGRDLLTRLPKAVVVSSVELRAALAPPVSAIVQLVRTALDETPPDVMGDILDAGITLVGGGAFLPGLGAHLARETNVPITLADDPLGSVVRGTGQMAEALRNRQYRRTLAALQPPGRRRVASSPHRATTR